MKDKTAKQIAEELLDLTVATGVNGCLNCIKPDTSHTGVFPK